MIRVLLLEDNAESADSMLRAFELRGVVAVHARTIEEARAAYEVDGFDVLVLDYEVPDGTGLDFLATIQGGDRATIVLYSGLDRSREIAASGLHVDYSISKADPGALLDLIEAAGR